MDIGLIDVDSHNFPNLALMKISGYHKDRGDNVEWWNGLKQYDVVYKSRIFDDTYSQDIDYCINADRVVKGGTGYDLKNELPYEIEHHFPDYNLYSGGGTGYDLQNKLPYEIEHTMPDYSLYQITDTAYGFLTRGCPRGCPFCIVSAKEGRVSRTVADLDEFFRGQKQIKLLDPNITASKDCEKLFDDLIQSKAWIDFTQGIDVRCLTDKGADQLNQMRIKMLHFAWDNYEFDTYEKLKRFRPMFKTDGRHLRVYVLTNFNTTHEQDLERIYKLKEVGYDPFVMIYDKPNAPQITRQVQRWCNSKWIFRSCEKFENYQGNFKMSL